MEWALDVWKGHGHRDVGKAAKEVEDEISSVRGRNEGSGTVAAYFDYVFRLQAMCSIQQGADFRLAFYGLCLELQGEVRRYMRRKQLQLLLLERLFEIATDAELSFRRQRGERERKEEGS